MKNYRIFEFQPSSKCFTCHGDVMMMIIFQETHASSTHRHTQMCCLRIAYVLAVKLDSVIQYKPRKSNQIMTNIHFEMDVRLNFNSWRVRLDTFLCFLGFYQMLSCTRPNYASGRESGMESFVFSA